MKNILLKRYLVIIVLILFFCASILPNIGCSTRIKNENTLNNSLTIPIFYTENIGQFDNNVLYQTKTQYSTVYLCKDNIVTVFSRPIIKNSDNYEVISIVTEFLDSNPDVEIFGKNPLQHNNNYFIGNNPKEWYTDVSNYEVVWYKNIYSGIDLKFYSDSYNLKYDFIVKPGADPSSIKIKYKGIEDLKITSNGDLEINKDFVKIIENRPFIYQNINGAKKEINGHFVKYEQDVFGFELNDNYKQSYPVIIDPTLSYSTYLGGSDGHDWGFDIAVDSSGNAYVVGNTDSTNFPTVNPYQGSSGGTTDIFVSKISSSGNTLLFSTYLGGSSSDEGYGIDIGLNDEPYITGTTYSNNYPTYVAMFPNLQGVQDAFITKLHPNGNSLIYSTYLGGTDWDWGYDIVVDSNEHASVIGWTTSTDFPVYNAYDASHNGGLDAFVCQIDQPGGGIAYSTYLGGTNSDVGMGIDIDFNGIAYITGYTWSSGYPVTPTTAYDPSYNGGGDIVVTILDTRSSGSSSLVYSTFIYGQGDDFGYAIRADSNGIVYVTGETSSTINQFFPVTTNAYQQYLHGIRDAFFFKLDHTLMPPYPTQMLYCTYLGGSTGGSGYDGAWCIDLDSNNNAYITGFTECSDFPTVNPLHNYKGSNEIFASLIDPTASGSASLLDSTYIGGTGADEGAGIAVDSNDDAYVTGGTSSTDYPTLNPYQGNLAGYSDAIVTKISPSWTNNPPGQPTTPSGPTKGKTGVLYPYQTDSVDPEGHKVRYGWDWDGDSVVDEWVDNSGAYYNSGATITTNHSWASKGTYNIKVIAEDIHGAQSSWSNSLAVKIPRIRSSTFPLIIRILQRYPNIFSLLRILFIN